MSKTSIFLGIFACSLVLFAGCASSKRMAAGPHPLVGSWEYAVVTPDGDYPGVITISEMDGALSGKITSSGLSGEIDLNDIVFENNVVTFNFNSSQYGRIAVKADVDGDNLSGTIDVGDFGEMPLNGMRKAAE